MKMTRTVSTACLRKLRLAKYILWNISVTQLTPPLVLDLEKLEDPDHQVRRAY